VRAVQVTMKGSPAASIAARKAANFSCSSGTQSSMRREAIPHPSINSARAAAAVISSSFVNGEFPRGNPGDPHANPGLGEIFEPFILRHATRNKKAGAGVNLRSPGFKNPQFLKGGQAASKIVAILLFF
jgi:hypothetical protein